MEAGSGWIATDESSNGIWVDGIKIEKGRLSSIKFGDLLNFYVLKIYTNEDDIAEFVSILSQFHWTYSVLCSITHQIYSAAIFMK